MNELNSNELKTLSPVTCRGALVKPNSGGDEEGGGRGGGVGGGGGADSNMFLHNSAEIPCNKMYDVQNTCVRTTYNKCVSVTSESNMLHS